MISCCTNQWCIFFVYNSTLSLRRLQQFSVKIYRDFFRYTMFVLWTSYSSNSLNSCTFDHSASHFIAVGSFWQMDKKGFQNWQVKPQVFSLTGGLVQNQHGSFCARLPSCGEKNAWSYVFLKLQKQEKRFTENLPASIRPDMHEVTCFIMFEFFRVDMLRIKRVIRLLYCYSRR